MEMNEGKKLEKENLAFQSNLFSFLFVYFRLNL